MNRGEAVALLRELGSKLLVNPDLVVIEERAPNKFQLKLKGCFNVKEIEVHLANRFALEENKGFLIISNR